jgi:stage V sporulation protein B
MSKGTFIKGAAILGLAGFMVQVLGAIFRIPLANIIGEDGMGYYQTIYPIYIFLLVFSTNGAPAAISKMVSERLALNRADEAHRVFKLSFVVMLVFGMIASSILFFFAREIIELLVVDENSYYAMAAIAPALLFIPIMAVFRGYFQGMQVMTPTALSQFVEQIIRVASGLALAVILLPAGIEYAAGGASLGTSIGPIGGIIVILIIYYTRKRRIFEVIERDKSADAEKEKAGSILKTLAVIAIPITIGVSIYPIMNLADVIFIQRRLVFMGLDGEAANALYGQLTGFAGPVINVPMALALSMALSMVPAIAAAKSEKDTETLNTNIKLGLRTSMIVGVPCCFGLIILAEPIMLLIYPLQVESAVNAAGSLAILAAGIIFLCIAQTMAGVLQGLSKIWIAVISITVGFTVKSIATYLLTPIPYMNIKGAALGSVLGFITVAAISFSAVLILTKIRFDYVLSVVKPVLAGIIMSIIVLAVYYGTLLMISFRLAVVISIAAGVVSYLIALVKLKAITESEMLILPKSGKIVSILKKTKLL